MSKLYFYGITRPREVDERLAGDGVYLVAKDGRAAIVSELEEEGPVEATRRNLLAHADVVEQLHEGAVVLPARFGHVLESREEALELLALPEIGQLLERHAQTCELTLKGKYEESVLAEIGAELQSLRDEYRAEPSVEIGIALGEAVGERLAERRVRDEGIVLDELSPLILDFVSSEPAGELAAFDLALLLDRDRVESVEKRVERLTTRLSPPLHFKLVGPLPPYSFVQLALPAVA
ncbi:MAG TPA: GvpL/GvpF family gas vesicle protein [Gaiellaceae bacterium]|nr:GvpL/GvpF family gas vesicle protein [Gaiellaceae bacterium]